MRTYLTMFTYVLGHASIEHFASNMMLLFWEILSEDSTPARISCPRYSVTTRIIVMGISPRLKEVMLHRMMTAKTTPLQPMRPLTFALLCLGVLIFSELTGYRLERRRIELLTPCVQSRCSPS